MSTSETFYETLSWLVVSTPLKNMSSSVGMMKFPIYGKSQKKIMFQTTNQYKTLSVGTQHAQLAPATFCPVAIVMQHCAPLKS